MAPLLAIYSKDELRKLYPHLFPERVELDSKAKESIGQKQTDGSPLFKLDSDNCELYSLSQFQCTFDGNKSVCIPFKRLFARCLDNEYAKRNELIGYKSAPPMHSDFHKRKHQPMYRNIELTVESDNDYLNQFYKSGDQEKKQLIDDFLRADIILQRKMAEYMEKFRKQEAEDDKRAKRDI